MLNTYIFFNNIMEKYVPLNAVDCFNPLKNGSRQITKKKDIHIFIHIYELDRGISISSYTITFL